MFVVFPPQGNIDLTMRPSGVWADVVRPRAPGRDNVVGFLMGGWLRPNGPIPNQPLPRHRAQRVVRELSAIRLGGEVGLVWAHGFLYCE